tara:strand:- start:2307 stop:2723 length:417 start_codon:yes stop_codon:yes gene_type:complete
LKNGRTKVAAKKRNLGDGVDGIAVSIANRIEAIRRANGVSREEVGTALDVGEQQVKKLLSGKSHLSAARLVILARVLDAPLTAMLSIFMDIEDVQELTAREIRLINGLRTLREHDQEMIWRLVEALEMLESEDADSKI